MEIKKEEKTHMYIHYIHIFGRIESSSVCVCECGCMSVCVWVYECVRGCISVCMCMCVWVYECVCMCVGEVERKKNKKRTLDGE